MPKPGADLLPDVILLGPPGSGKGTQATLLRDRFGYQSLAIGELLRDRAKTEDAIGKELAAALAAGRLIDDDVTEAVLTERLARIDPSLPIVYDGFPRRTSQLPALDRLVGRRMPRPTLAIILNLPDSLAFARLQDRKVCRDCGSIGRKHDAVCRVCTGPMIDRTDQRTDVHRERLALYRSEEADLIRALTEDYPIHSIDADRSSDVIHRDVVALVNLPGSDR